MSTHPGTVNSAGLDGQSQDPRKTESGTVAEELDSFDEDLHGNDRAGQHAGVNEIRNYSAFDIKALHAQMPDFDNGELKRIPILAHGEALEQGASYLDLSDQGREAFTAQGGMISEDPHLYVPKAHTDYELWNKLIGRPDRRP